MRARLGDGSRAARVESAQRLALAAVTTLAYRFYFFHTPIDETRTMGTMFQYRGFLRQPVVKQGFNWVFTKLVRRAIAEDGELMRAQMLNSQRDARSTAAYYFDGVLAKYYKWQRRREPEDLWFRGFEHERLRWTGRGGVHLPIVAGPAAPPASDDDGAP